MHLLLDRHRESFQRIRFLVESARSQHTRKLTRQATLMIFAREKSDGLATVPAAP
jgi:hypothetical protein